MIDIAVSLLPVLGFLGLLVLMDSFKLVTGRSVCEAIAAGVLVALACARLNPWLLDRLALEPAAFSRYVAPLSEEIPKALYAAFLIRTSRVGFLVDAAILGFAVGAGFALVENVEYLDRVAEGSILLAIVRGLGTAVLHGATTSIFAILSKGLADRHREHGLGVYLPGLGAAVLLHSAFNHFLLPPLVTTAVLLLVLPLLMAAVFERSERTTREWLGVGFDSDVELLGLITSGELGATRVGAYLRSLKSRFSGSVVGDMLCLLRVHLELSIRAKGMLLASRAGFKVTIGEDVRANLVELSYLEKAIGPTGRLAVQTLLGQSGRELWQVYRFGR